MKQTTLESLRGLPLAELVSKIQQNCIKGQSLHIGTGKMLFALDALRAGQEKTLLKFAKKQGLGEIHPNAYSCTKAFGYVGEGPGKISEDDYDGAALRWLLVVCKIDNVLEERPGHPENASEREKVAAIIRDAKTKPQRDAVTGKLEAIYKLLKPADDEKPKTEEEVLKEGIENVKIEDVPTHLLILLATGAAHKLAAILGAAAQRLMDEDGEFDLTKCNAAFETLRNPWNLMGNAVTAVRDNLDRLSEKSRTTSTSVVPTVETSATQIAG